MSSDPRGSVGERSEGGLERLIAARRSGFALDREFYRDPGIYRRELDEFLLRHWLCAGHANRIPQPGDYFLFEIAGESLIIVRGRQGEVRALANVCRHRGSRICYDTEGNTRLFLCPYHGWGYELDGSLRVARHMDAGFDRGRYPLKRVHCRVVQGLIFVNFGEAPLGLDAAEVLTEAVAGPYGWANARVAHRELYPIAANWKLAVENYLECYHCAPAHPEYAKLHGNERPGGATAQSVAAALSCGRAMGIEIPAVDQWALDAPPHEEGMLSIRYPMLNHAVTGSRDGGPVAPLMGKFSGYDGAATFFHIGPASYYLAYCDYGVMYRFTPRDVQESELEVTWLVADGAEPGVDYDLERLTWLWKLTSEQDQRIIENNQAGVNSRLYEPGPYSEMESNPRRFTEWLLRELVRNETP